MIEYRVEWAKCPTRYNATNVMFVEADSPEDAMKIAKDHIERKHGIGDWISMTAREVDPVPLGRVIG